MITVRQPDWRRHALEYYRRNVGDDSKLSSVLLKQITSAEYVKSSFEFSSLPELEYGRRDNRLINDICEIFYDPSDIERKLYVLDVWSKLEDASAADMCNRFSPAVVYEVGGVGEVDQSMIRAAHSLCISFVTVWFSVALQSCPKAVAISAFDQEGCIAWVHENGQR